LLRQQLLPCNPTPQQNELSPAQLYAFHDSGYVAARVVVSFFSFFGVVAAGRHPWPEKNLHESATAAAASERATGTALLAATMRVQQCWRRLMWLLEPLWL